jgi:acyl-CoA reductase-like NAD-dependent aldehyde dehydrogenase
MMAAWKLAPALACGNTMIMKPAEQTPLSMLRFAELLADAGLPAGVVNVLNGMGETTGQALVEHAGIDKVAFTGSAEVGKLITKSSIGNLKRVSLELGGKSPNVIFADARSDRVDGALWGIYYNMGQDCTAGSRPVVVAMPFGDEDELVRKANDTVYGLGAAVWTSDVKRAHRVAHRIKAGSMWINCYGVTDPAAPFGGFKQSCHGREMGEYALELCTEVKCVWTNLD